MGLSLNKAMIIGHLGKDPDVRQVGQSQFVSFSVATSDGWKDKNTGDWVDKTEWHLVSIQNDRLAKYAEQTLRKGSKVYVEGKIQTRKWTDKGGSERSIVEIVIGPFNGDFVVLDPKQKDPTERQASSWGDAPRASTPAKSPPPVEDDDDEIPF